jgi:hypothetical protein
MCDVCVELRDSSTRYIEWRPLLSLPAKSCWFCGAPRFGRTGTGSSLPEGPVGRPAAVRWVIIDDWCADVVMYVLG